MATLTKFNVFLENLAEGVHNLGSHALTVALVPEANPPIPTNSTLSELTQATYTFASSRVLSVASSSQTAGVYKLFINDLTLTASGGAVGPFRYVVLYNDTPTSPADPLIGWYDYGSNITLQSGESILLDFDGVNGVLGLQ
jgi:hypothetical protein